MQAISHRGTSPNAAGY